MFQQLIHLMKQTYEDDTGRSEMLVDTLWRIDHNKMIDRMWMAMENQSKETKCVLFEYNWTSLQDVRERGLPNIVTRLPNGMLYHDALIRYDICGELEKMFNNPRILVYRRRKIRPDNSEDRHRMQVVLVFTPYAFLPPPSPIVARQVSSVSSETYDWTPNN
jgi:hypothetical protein